MDNGPRQIHGKKNGSNGSNGYHRVPEPLRRESRRPPRRWQDVVTLILGAWLVATPWVWPNTSLVLDSSIPGESAWAAWIPGGVIIIMALWARARPVQTAPEWVMAGAGFWMVVSPCLPGFSRLTSLASPA